MNILFICPLFHGYYKKIKEVLESNGHNVYYYPIEDNFKFSVVENFIRKITIKPYYKRLDAYIENIISNEKKHHIDKVVLIFGGSFFRVYNYHQLKKQFKNAEFIYYAWDSVSNYNNIKSYYNLFDRFYSFDLCDCKEYGFKHLPLFYIYNKQNENTNVKYDYGILMTIGKKKYKGYIKVKNALKSIYSSKEYLVMDSKAQYIYNSIRWHKLFKKINKNHIHFNQLSLSQSSHFFDDCKVVIDIPLEGQNGLTIRTFEALSQQKKIITSNKNIVNYEFYSPHNIFIVNSDDDIVPDSFFNSQFDTKYGLSDKYSIESFVNTLFGLSDYNE